MSRQWSRSELAQQLRNEIMGYFGAASDFDERVAKKLKLGRTDIRCLDLIGRLGPLTAGRLAEESGLTTGAVTFILDRLEEAGMVRRRRDTEDRRRVWGEIVPEAPEQLAGVQEPVGAGGAGGRTGRRSRGSGRRGESRVKFPSQIGKGTTRPRPCPPAVGPTRAR